MKGKTFAERFDEVQAKVGEARNIAVELLEEHASVAARELHFVCPQCRLSRAVILLADALVDPEPPDSSI